MAFIFDLTQRDLPFEPMLSELLQNPNILKIGRDTHTFSSIQIVAHVLLVMDRLLPWAILAKSDKMLVILYSSNMLWWF